MLMNEKNKETCDRLYPCDYSKLQYNHRETIHYTSAVHLATVLEDDRKPPTILRHNGYALSPLCHSRHCYNTQLSFPPSRSSVQMRKLSFRRDTAPNIYGESRFTLLGKPIQTGMKLKQSFKYRQIQTRVFNFLEQPKGWEFLYHIAIFLLVFGCLVLSVLATIPEPPFAFANTVLLWLEIVILVLFSIELILRLWSAGCRCRYQGFFGILRFCKKPFCLIDIIVILSSVVVICIGTQGNVFATTAMRGLRFLQILRMVRMDRRGGTWKLLSSVVMAHSKELITAWYIGFLTLVFASFLVYQAEKEQNPEEFGNYADGLWWGLVSLTTIGYGDKVPKTWVGRLVASFFTILGISFFSLPAGILGSGFALKVQEQHRQKHFARRRMPAAYLIQCMWRCYAADKNSRSVATWLPHLRARLNKKNFKDVLRTNNHSPKLSRKATFRSRFGGKSSISSNNIAMNGPNSPSTHSHSGARNEVPKSYSLAEKLSDRLSLQSTAFKMPWKERQCSEKKSTELTEQTVITDDYDDYSSGSSNSDTNEGVLTEQHKCAVRCLRMMKFLVAKRKFKEALRPYDVKDVIEQYSSGHVEMLARIKNLQNRVDMILGINSSETMVGNPPSYYYRSIRSNSEVQHCHAHTHPDSMNSRLTKVETDVQNIDRKIDIMLDAISRKNSSQASPSSRRRVRKGFTAKDSIQEDTNPLQVEIPLSLNPDANSDLQEEDSSPVFKSMQCLLPASPQKYGQSLIQSESQNQDKFHSHKSWGDLIKLQKRTEYYNSDVASTSSIESKAYTDAEQSLTYTQEGKRSIFTIGSPIKVNKSSLNKINESCIEQNDSTNRYFSVSDNEPQRQIGSDDEIPYLSENFFKSVENDDLTTFESEEALSFKTDSDNDKAVGDVEIVQKPYASSGTLNVRSTGCNSPIVLALPQFENKLFPKKFRKIQTNISNSEPSLAEEKSRKFKRRHFKAKGRSMAPKFRGSSFFSRCHLIPTKKNYSFLHFTSETSPRKESYCTHPSSCIDISEKRLLPADSTELMKTDRSALPMTNIRHFSSDLV